MIFIHPCEKAKIAMHSRREFIGAAAAIAATSTLPSVGFAGPIPDIKGLNPIYDTDHLSAEFNKAYAAQRKHLPKLRLMCGNETAAQAAVKWARNEGQKFASRSGGHCFMGFSQNKNLVLDVREMREIKIDPAARRLRVGSGARLDIIYNAINPLGLSLAGGTFGGVGIAGHTLGGGFGARCRADGLLIDNLLAVDLITADGSKVTASATQNSDLFWACRGGGGGQFGLVTSFTFALQKRAPTHRIAIIEPANIQRTAEILFLWHHWTLNSPRHLTTHLQIGRRGKNGFLISLKGLAEGNRNDLMEELRLLLRRDAPVHDNLVTSNSTGDLIKQPHEGKSTTQANLLTHSHFLKGALSEQAVADIITAIQRHPNDAMTVNFEPIGGAVSDIDAKATAFPHRNVDFVVHVQADVHQPQDMGMKQAALDEMRSILTPIATEGVYANYPDLTLENWGHAYWGENLSRLKRIKQKWDPDNYFDHAHSIAKA